MRKIHIATSLGLLCLLFSFITMAYTAEPTNLALVKQQLINYYQDGSYLKDQKHTIRLATSYLKQRLALQKKRPSNKPLAMVLDIDETSLSNYPDMISWSFAQSPDVYRQSIAKGTDSSIAPTLALYQFAKANQVAVFFVTGRRENLRQSTESNLLNAGYKKWDGLYMKANDDPNPSNIAFKVASRKDIEKRGFDTIINIGDQQSDLIGGYADKDFKMPNPYYQVP